MARERTLVEVEPGRIVRAGLSQGILSLVQCGGTRLCPLVGGLRAGFHRCQHGLRLRRRDVLGAFPSGPYQVNGEGYVLQM